MRKTPIYYLPGRGGRLIGGLGSFLSGFGTVVGRELAGDFAKLSFGEQVELLRADLSGQDYFVVANSYGCYLLLNALFELPGYAGKILLLSPVLGDAENPETGMVYCPPRAQRFVESLRSGRLRLGAAMQVLVGSEDWQCNREGLGLLKGLDAVDVKEVEGEGHRIPASVVLESSKYFGASR
jgi:pimeloyl-ACP methyl ester carboxylesterase